MTRKLKRRLEHTSTAPTLDKVVTMREAREMFGLSVGAIVNSIQKNYVRARQSGATWLIYLPDLIKAYGLPAEEADLYVD